MFLSGSCVSTAETKKANMSYIPKPNYTVEPYFGEIIGSIGQKSKVKSEKSKVN
jgi:hypothetical protein